MDFLRWFFGREITREEAMRIATQFARGEWDADTADWLDKIDFPYDLGAASLGENYWYVRFVRRWPEGIASGSNELLEIWVHKQTGVPDHVDTVWKRCSDQLERSE